MSAFSSRGGREEKLKCTFIPVSGYEANFILDLVAFKVYDVDRDGYISNGELFLVLKMMVGNNLKVRLLNCIRTQTFLNARLQDQQLQQIVDKTIMEADLDGDGKLSFDEFAQTVSNTVRVEYSYWPM